MGYFTKLKHSQQSPHQHLLPDRLWFKMYIKCQSTTFTFFFARMFSHVQSNKNSTLMYCVTCRADTSFISFRGLHLRHSLCHGALVGCVWGRLLQGHGGGRKWDAADVHQPAHQLSDLRTELWPELRGACDTHVRELQEHDEHHLSHFSDWWDTIMFSPPMTICCKSQNDPSHFKGGEFRIQNIMLTAISF